MTKIKAFFTALAIFLVIVTVTHFAAGSMPLKSDTAGFGTWDNTYKDLSYNVLSENLGEDTMLLLGSSEFRHGTQTPFHPKNFFKGHDIDLLIVGRQYTQSLFNTILVGGLDKSMKNRKVVLLVSQTWFKDEGLLGENYALRFSETEYMAFMENKDIPEDIRTYVRERTETLLADDPAKFAKARLIGLMGGQPETGGILDRMLYGFRRIYATDQDRMSIKPWMIVGARDEYGTKDVVSPAKPGSDIDWAAMRAEGDAFTKPQCTNNDYYIRDDVWNRQFRNYRSLKNYHRDETLSKSSEYKDLEYFMKLCQALDLDAEVIVMPVNGNWYEYTGLDKEKRGQCLDRIKSMGQTYGVKVVDQTVYDFEPYVVEDAVHPWGKGWVLINEELYNFYHKN